MPVIPATGETEAGESLETGKRKLLWAEIMPLHSSLSDSKTPSQKKKKKLEENLERESLFLHTIEFLAFSLLKLTFKHEVTFLLSELN